MSYFLDIWAGERVYSETKIVLSSKIGLDLRWSGSSGVGKDLVNQYQ